jgi:hypothetical protein
VAAAWAIADHGLGWHLPVVGGVAIGAAVGHFGRFAARDDDQRSISGALVALAAVTPTSPPV